MQAIISLDIGTSSVRALVFDSSFKIRNIFQTELKSFYPQKGWVEQEPSELWRKSQNVLEKAANFAVKKKWEIKGIGITNKKKQLLPGLKKLVVRFIGRLFGRIVGQRSFVSFYRKKVLQKKFIIKPVYVLILIFLLQK